MQLLISNQEAISRYKTIFTRNANTFIQTGDNYTLELALYALTSILRVKRDTNPQRTAHHAEIRRRMAIRLTSKHISARTKKILTTKLSRQKAA